MIDKISDKECIICWEKITDLYITECIHHYDLDCIYIWIMYDSKCNKLCPICQTPLNKQDIINLYNIKYGINKFRDLDDKSDEIYESSPNNNQNCCLIMNCCWNQPSSISRRSSAEMPLNGSRVMT